MKSKLLNNTREKNKLLCLVGSAKLPPVPLFFPLCPIQHGKATDSPKNDCSPGEPAHNRDYQPGKNLKAVVGAGNGAETEALGDHASGTAFGTEVCEGEVADHVAKLKDGEKAGKYDLHLRLVCPVGGLSDMGERCLNTPGKKYTSKKPVMGTVAEHIVEWHGSRGKLVYKEGLILALEEVHKTEDHEEPLGRAWRVEVRWGNPRIGKRAECIIKKGMNDERTEILDEVD